VSLAPSVFAGIAGAAEELQIIPGSFLAVEGSPGTGIHPVMSGGADWIHCIKGEVSERAAVLASAPKFLDQGLSGASCPIFLAF
jgi:hypothetical protein